MKVDSSGPIKNVERMRPDISQDDMQDFIDTVKFNNFFKCGVLSGPLDNASEILKLWDAIKEIKDRITAIEKKLGMKCDD